MVNASDAAVRQVGAIVLTAVQELYQVGADRVVVGGSIGVAVGHGRCTAAEIMRDADIAMYQAKHAGGGRIMAFDQCVSDERQAKILAGPATLAGARDLAQLPREA